MSSYILLYCKSIPVGTCPEIGDYPSVEEGENSYSGCEEGYGGYSYRSCFNGQLGGINNQHCIQLEPENLAYEKSAYNLIIDIPVTIPAPKYENIIDEFYLAENNNLPPGLELNRLTGEITGTPTGNDSHVNCIIYGKNQVGRIATTLEFVNRWFLLWHSEESMYPWKYRWSVAKH